MDPHHPLHRESSIFYWVFLYLLCVGGQTRLHQIERHTDISRGVAYLFCDEFVCLLIHTVHEEFLKLWAFQLGRQPVEQHVFFCLQNVDQLLVVVGPEQQLAVTHRNCRVLLTKWQVDCVCNAHNRTVLTLSQHCFDQASESFLVPGKLVNFIDDNDHFFGFVHNLYYFLDDAVVVY